MGTALAITSKLCKIISSNIRSMQLNKLIILLLLFWPNSLFLQNQFAISNVNVIPMHKVGIIMNQTVLVGNGTIEKIGDSGNINIPPHYTVVDGTGKYLLPGFINMYTHVNESNLLLYLANGQTTIRDIPSHINVLGLRDKVARGELLGPRILSYGLRATGAPAPYHSQQPIFTADQGREQVKEAKRLGYDGMMIYATCAPDTYQAILEEAEKLDFPISGHFPLFVESSEVFEGKQREFDNLTGITRRGKLRLEKSLLLEQLKKYEKCITPSLAVHYSWTLSHKKDSLFSSSLLEYIPTKLKAAWKPDSNAHQPASDYPYHEVAQLIKEVSDNNIQLFLGSDGGYPLVIPGFSYLDEMKLFSEAGISNRKILEYATIDAANFLKLYDIGSIEVGKRADLLLLSHNPLIDIENVRKIEGVAINGNWLPHADLQESLINLKEENKAPKNRFNKWNQYLKNDKNSTQLKYSFRINGEEVGQQIILLDSLENNTFAVRSVMVADSPYHRETYSYHQVKNNSIDSLFIYNVGSEGLTQATLTTRKDSSYIFGQSPYHGTFSYEKFSPYGTQLWSPFISRYFDLDNVVNYHLAITLQGGIKAGEANQFNCIQVELNSEEFGEKYILDEALVTIYRKEDDQYQIIYPGFSGYKNRTSLPFNVSVKTDTNNYIDTIEYNDYSIIKIQ